MIVISHVTICIPICQYIVHRPIPKSTRMDSYFTLPLEVDQDCPLRWIKRCTEVPHASTLIVPTSTLSYSRPASFNNKSRVSLYATPLTASEEKSLWEVARILTGRYNYAHADGGTHAGACLLPGTVEPIRICPVAAKQPPGRQQRHHQHLPSRHSATQFSVISTWALHRNRGLHIGS